MRRSAAILSLLLLPLAVPAHAAPARSPAVLTVGIVDPSLIVAVSMWSLMQVARVMEMTDAILEHVREDIRRSQHPNRVPRIFPVPRPVPITPVLVPVRTVPAKPIVDTLPVEAGS